MSPRGCGESRIPGDRAKKRTLLPQLRLSLLHGRNNHIANTSIRETVEVGAGAVRLNNEEGLGAAVVRAVEDGTSGQTHGHPELVARGTRTCSAHHEKIHSRSGPVQDVKGSRNRIRT